jgi:S1-C subfamily serine protease
MEPWRDVCAQAGSSMLSRIQLNKLAETLQGIAVWGCLSGSRAQRAGVGYGDVVLSVNGVRTTNMDEYLQARSLRKDVIQLVVFRDGAEVPVDIQLDPGQQREFTRDELESVAAEIVAARMVPTDRPPPPDEDLQA